jgi:hypothetical protein
LIMKKNGGQPNLESKIAEFVRTYSAINWKDARDGRAGLTVSFGPSK